MMLHWAFTFILNQGLMLLLSGQKKHQMITDTDPAPSLLTWSELNIKLNWMISVTSALHEHPLFVKGKGLMVSITVHFVIRFNSFNGYTCFLFSPGDTIFSIL